MSGIVYYPDGASFQAGISLKGWGAFMAKATEGTGYRNPAYPAMREEARRRGARFGAYHFLHGGNAAAQADYCWGVVGRGVPLMVDHEPTAGAVRQLLGLAPDGGVEVSAAVRGAALLPDGLEHGHADRLVQVSAAEARTVSRPSVQDTAQFVDRYRALGGLVFLVYLPRWYWGLLGSPSLAPLASRGLELVTSNYSGASPDNRAHPGWQAYGGMPAVKTLQYTSGGAVNGMRPVDLNAFRGSGHADPAVTAGELWNLWTTGRLAAGPQQHPTIQLKATGPAVKLAQQRLNAHGARPILTADGRFGALTKAAAVAFQHKHSLAADGIIGPATWAALMKAPA